MQTTNQSASTTEDAAPELTVSALICTCARGDSIVPTLKSILRPGKSCLELIVIDQSDDDRTQEAVQPFLGDARLRYIRTKTKGKGLALNMGLEEARGDIVAITDDDCEVSDVWPLCHGEVFRKNPKVAITYGNVLPVDYDQEKGFIPVYYIEEDRLCRNIMQKIPARGIGANMAVRRDVALQIGGFDPELGPGGRFFACVDGDMTVRVLLAGHYAYETKDSSVYHYGFRTWEQGRKITRNAFFGIGAAYVKPLKCGRWNALPLLGYEFFVQALLPSVWATLTFRRPTGWQRVLSLLRGMAQGWKSPVDRAKVVYLRNS